MCKDLINRYVKNYGNGLYVVFRVIVGYLFFAHGAGKLFGVLGGPGPFEVMSLMGLAGIIETLVGLGIFFGVFSRLASIGGLAVMIGALITQHIPKGINPMTNGGELALIYLAVFLTILANGNGKLSLEKKVLKKEVF